MKKEVVLYNTEGIVSDLNIHSLYDFIQILILLGTDYSSIYTIGIKQAIEYYREYKKEENLTIDWYHWLQNKYELPQENIFESLYNQFISVYSKTELHIYKELYMKQIAGYFQIEKIQKLMDPYGFVFL
jgi:5'-3' exonuclease